MALYHYRSTTDQGQVRQGQIEALHELDLQTQLQRMGLTLLRARPVRARSQVKRLPRRELISLLFQLELLVRAGVSMTLALTDLRESCESPASRQLAAGLSEKIEGGALLGQAMAAYPGVFSETVTQLVRSAEASGQLGEVLQDIVRSLKWQDELAAQTKKLLIYPSFVIVVISAVLVFLMIYVVPQLVGFLHHLDQEIPLQTRLLIGLSALLLRHGAMLLLLLLALVLLTAALVRTSEVARLRLHQAELTLPLLGPILKKMALARFADTLALLYRTGVPVPEALMYCQKISSNLALQQALGRARERVLSGSTLSDSFAAESLFPALAVRMLKVGETTSALDSALRNISYFYSRDIDEAVGRLQALIEPALTLVMGLLLGWIMLAVLGPIYDTLTRLKV